MKKKRLGTKGFTIVELLVCIAVAGVLIGALNEVVSNYLHLGQRGRYLNLANSFVEAKVESLRNQGYNSLGLGTSSLTSALPSQLPPSRSGSMTVSAPSGLAGLKQIDITVSYNDQGNPVSYSYTTYIGELGVGQ